MGKRVRVESLHEVLTLYAEAQTGKGDVVEVQIKEGDIIDLPCSLPTALFLWAGFRDHGLLPYGGKGLLEQPRWFYQLNGIMNQHYNPIWRHAIAESQTTTKDEDALDDILENVPFSDGQRPSWETFRGG